MPTGYTEKVGTGEVTDFTQYALICARAFSACVTLRDDPLSSDIPVLEEAEYYLERLREVKQDFNQLINSSDEELKEMYALEQAKNKEIAHKRIAEKLEIRRRYEAMLEKAKSFVSPSDEYKQYAQFLVDQLKQSIDFDCCTEHYEGSMEEIPFDDWKIEKYDELLRSLHYAEKDYSDEKERVASRNQWISGLKKALGLIKVKNE